MTADTYRDLAIRCAEWIDRSGESRSGGLAWPADPARPLFIGLDLYSGTPGVVRFFASLYHATGDPRWRERADQGGAYIMASSARRAARLDGGLYTGLAGLVTTYMALDATGVGASWQGVAREAASTLVARAKPVGHGLEWSGANDIIEGTAGTGLLLLHAASAWSDGGLLDAAVRAGRRLLETGRPAEGGLMWFPSASVAQNYPNFAHGTSGVAYFLATLHQQTKEPAFLDAALAGARYLEAIATRQHGGRAIFHRSGDGMDRFYAGWCQGPVGTARLFYRLLQATGDPRWRRWIDDLTAWIVESGAPEARWAGYWNNISLCCGDAGLGQYCIDLARHHPIPAADGLRRRVVTSILSRMTGDDAGARWVQAENRTQPEHLVAQTGLMQGSAGVGMFFLQLDAFMRGVTWATPMPDTPWV